MAAKETLALWGPDGMDLAELGADIAAEADRALFLTAQIKDLDERIANLWPPTTPANPTPSSPRSTSG